MSRVSINQVIADPELLHHDDCWSFYDWFCKESSLQNRAKAMIPKLKFLVKEGIVNGDTCYVWFKNNCPCNGSLYDDLRISRISDDEFLGGVCPRTGHRNQDMKASYWTFDEDRNLEMHEFKDYTEMKSHLRENYKDSYIYE